MKRIFIKTNLHKTNEENQYMYVAWPYISSSERIRNNFENKWSICELSLSDIRITDICDFS